MSTTITLEFEADEVAVLSDQARIRGVEVDNILHELVAQLKNVQVRGDKPELNDKQKAAIALMQSWREEDETHDPDELADRDRELEEFKTNINRWRTEEGRAPAF